MRASALLYELALLETFPLRKLLDNPLPCARLKKTIAVRIYSQAAGKFFTRPFGCLLACAALFVPPEMRADVFALDDGSAEASGGTPGGDLLTLNHFDTGGRTVLIDQISV